MIWFVALATVGVILGAMVLAAGVGGGIDAVERLPRQRLPDRALTAEDVRRAWFTTVPGGYDPAAVDALLDRVASQWQSSLDEAVAAGEQGSEAGGEEPHHKA